MSIPGTQERAALLETLGTFLGQRKEVAAVSRREWFQPDMADAQAYAASLPPYREEWKRLLGWPLTEPAAAAETECELVSQDAQGRVYRVSQRLFGVVRTYGLLFLPTAEGRYPLVIAQHGGKGSPELAAGLTEIGSANYNRLVRGLRERGIAVFAQQLLVWDDGQEPKFDQYLLDRKFRHLGGSRVAFDLCQLQGSFNWLVEHPEIDADHVGMAGLSYGGFYTLAFTAMEPRIRVAVASCFVNDRFRYNWEDLVWNGSALRFLDSEIARLVCPRPLFLEAGETDEVFSVEGFFAPSEEVAHCYAALGIGDRLERRTHPGGHEYDIDGRAEAFLLKWL
ncbi:MAG: hypothetical protein BGO12_22480 [Verrucomicrobia bacterium 61-8]|nr:acetylxylan esterase [Verrucomicrobiota bacterium]OJV04589.1 MAG: hypothetical protein BGO12_22480 [Verrucomicrobia bacterium 61-8]